MGNKHTLNKRIFSYFVLVFDPRSFEFMLSFLKKTFLTKSYNLDQGRNIILTGIPRSGTTLACKILTTVDNQIALNEPIDSSYFKKNKSGEKVVEEAFQIFRKQLLKEKRAPVRTQGGQITDNNFSGNSGNRTRVVQRQLHTFDKPLKEDFTLIMKHCAEFTLLMPGLCDRYECYALIRNPLALLASWNSVNIPASRGRIAKARILQPQLYKTLQSFNNLQDQQLYILNWYFHTLSKSPRIQLIKYEDMIASRGANLLESLSDQNSKDLPELTSKNDNKLYDASSMEKFLDKLLKNNQSFTAYYTNQDLEELFQQMQA